ncbi:NAD(P)H-dependent flavin oxidoreductase [Hyphococcus sp. DH-69]|uniref:NAD(P)H-dependent flavin oxidoreductase n=1 Tax=Hyphococcus formosus TaxID=3143534 RepID=UPI00398ABAF6
MADPFHTALCERTGCRYPIIQTAMGWVATPDLVIASCQAGALGFLAGAVMTPPELTTAIARVKAVTNAPFGVNFHMFQPGAEEIVDIIIREKVAAVSFGRGPNADMIARFRDAGILTIPTVGALKHARKVADLGVDMITVQGGEGGGHTGGVATTVLLPQILDEIDIPVVAAGGFGDGRGLAAALAYGAAGIAMGTRFLLCKESPVPPGTKDKYLNARGEDIIVSSKIDGLPQRAILNEKLRKIEQSSPLLRWREAIIAGLELKKQTGASSLELLRSLRSMTAQSEMTLTQAMMAAASPMLIRKAIVEGKPEQGIMASGQVAGRIEEIPSCQELIENIMSDASARIASLCG